MKLTRVIRLACLSVVIAAGLAALAGPAAAGGLPEIEDLSQTNTNIANTKVEAEVNPNGATTNFKVEYRESSLESWASSPEQNLGSGTTWQIASANVALAPETTYELRISATNSFGTARELVTKTYASPRWVIEGGAGTSAFTAEGTWSTAWNRGGVQQKMECYEHGSGTIGNPRGVGDKYFYQIEKCSWYIEGKLNCVLAGPWNWEMSGRTFTELLGGGRYFHCTGEEGQWPMGGQGEKYALSMPTQTVLSEQQQVTMTLPITMQGFSKATATSTLTWRLSSPNFGKKFKVEL